MTARRREIGGPSVPTGPPLAPRRLITETGDRGIRLDAFVGRHAGLSVAAARRLIAAGAVHVDGAPAVKGSALAVGASVEIAAFADPRGPVVPEPELRVPILYQDADVVALDKPAGMPAHPLRPGERGTAANALVAGFPECATASADPREGGLGHRLDNDTSGVLLAARSPEAWTGLRRALAAPDCEKRYLCQVWGRPPADGEIEAAIGRAGRRGGRVRVGGGRSPRAARTSWTVVNLGPETALLEARLHSGRAHQVRAHLAAAGFPIVGDDRYGGARPGAAGAAPEGLRLHALSVRMSHPRTGARLFVEAPPPDWAVAAKTSGKTR